MKSHKRCIWFTLPQDIQVTSSYKQSGSPGGISAFMLLWGGSGKQHQVIKVKKKQLPQRFGGHEHAMEMSEMPLAHWRAEENRCWARLEIRLSNWGWKNPVRTRRVRSHQSHHSTSTKPGWLLINPHLSVGCWLESQSEGISDQWRQAASSKSQEWQPGKEKKERGKMTDCYRWRKERGETGWLVTGGAAGGVAGTQQLRVTLEEGEQQ